MSASTSKYMRTITGINANNDNKKTSKHRAPRTDSPKVRLSKALSWLLRHNAESQGIAIRSDGYVKIKDVLAHPKFKNFTLDDILEVVETDDKKRFQILEDANGHKEYIRAVQGHSIDKVADPGCEEITDASQLPTVIHGTTVSKWPLIAAEKGLSRMNRNHIHMAVGLLGEDGVISGMRHNCSLYIHIDAASAMKDGIKFYRSANNVVLSDGKDGDGVIPARYFSQVVTSKNEIIFPKPTSP
ncbi:hypothetical protein BGX28_003142 [Mortierella sp. GBA30]|nr:hypothetical protein BGX28_003142 [Mortierella sp. GBA30]